MVMTLVLTVGLVDGGGGSCVSISGVVMVIALGVVLAMVGGLGMNI